MGVLAAGGPLPPVPGGPIAPAGAVAPAAGVPGADAAPAIGPAVAAAVAPVPAAAVAPVPAAGAPQPAPSIGGVERLGGRHVGRDRRARNVQVRRDSSPSLSDAIDESSTSRLTDWPFAEEVLNALDDAGGVSCHHYVSTVNFRDTRAQKECLQLGLFVDAYLSMRVGDAELPLDSLLLDLMCRRLIGVMHADANSNWSLAAATERVGTVRMASNELVMRMSRYANAYDRMRRAVSKGSDGTAGSAVRVQRTRRGRRGGARNAASGDSAQSNAAARGAAKSG